MHYYVAAPLDVLDPDATVIEEVERVAPEAARTRLRTLLAPFFSRGRGGEESGGVVGRRESPARPGQMLVRPAALLCLDEPTNHLDLASREVR